MMWNSTFGFLHDLRNEHFKKIISPKDSIIVTLVCNFTFCFPHNLRTNVLKIFVYVFGHTVDKDAIFT